MLPHKPHSSERLHPAQPVRQPRGNYKSRLPVKSNVTRLRYGTAPPQERGSKPSLSPVAKLEHVPQNSGTTVEGVEAPRKPEASTNRSPTQVLRPQVALEDLRAKSGNAQGLAIRYTSVDDPEHGHAHTSKRGNLPTISDRKDVLADHQTARDSYQTRAKCTNTSLNISPSLSSERIGDYITVGQTSSPTIMSRSRQDVGMSGRIIPELRSLMSVPKSDYVLPSTPNVPLTTTPSSRYSESPRVWSSRDTTPTSMSSYSPALVHSFSPSHKLSPRNLDQPAPWLNAAWDVAGQSPLDLLDDVTQKETIVSDGTSFSTLLPSPGVKRPRPRKKRSHADNRPPLIPPPRKSSAKFASFDRSMRGPKQPTDTVRSNGTPLQSEIIGESRRKFGHADAEYVRKSRYDQKPERPSREGVNFLSESRSHSPFTKRDIGTLPPLPSTSGGQNFPMSHELQFNQGQMVEEIAQKMSSRQAPADRISPRATGLTAGRSVRRASSADSADSHRASREQRSHHGDHAEPSQSNEMETKSRRFRFLGRKTKSKKDDSHLDKPAKTLRKGPAAGTGYENVPTMLRSTRRPSIGGIQGRQGSLATAPKSASGSVTSLRSHGSSERESDMDDFLSQRLEPIILRGGGGPLGSHPSLNDENEVPLSKLNDRERGTTQRATATSPQTDIFSAENLVARSPSLIAHDTTMALSSPQYSNDTAIASEPYNITDAFRSTILDKRAKASRWNIFSRNRKASHGMAEAETPSKLTVTVAPTPDARPLAFYAMDDAESDVEDIELYDDVAGHKPCPSWISAGSDLDSQKAPHHKLRRQQGYSILLPSPPINVSEFQNLQRSPSPRVFFHQENTTDFGNETLWSSPAEQQGSVQIDHAPTASSSPDREPTSFAKYFSRPFRPERVPPRTETFPSIQSLKATSSSVNSNTTDFYGCTRSHTAPPYHINTDKISDIQGTWDPSTGYELLEYSPKTASEIPAPLTPKTRSSGAPGARIRQDEVWREYDDLIDHVLSPFGSPQVTDTSVSHAHEQRRSSLAPSRIIPEFRGLLDQQPAKPFTATERVASFEPHSTRSEPLIPISPLQTPSTLLPPLASPKSSESVRLRRSRITSALRSSVTPSEPISERGSIETKDDAVFVTSSRQQQRDSSHHGDASSILDLDNISTAPHTLSHQINTTMLDIAERSRDGPIALSNLRYGALMTSRWLSFGRVLFSPAHDKLQDSVNDRILVIDGLGNDDWSFYCALTYPNATVYNLSGRDPFTARTPTNNDWKAPTNHRNVNHVKLSEPFPFPRSFFTVVVFRYPAAMPEQALRRAISECKRVLQPGGYVELSVIDLDMVNMGNRTRRAVRMLKTRMSVADPDVCLKPAVDNIQRLLGRRGFENLSRCIVGLPVAGAVGSLASESSRASNGSSGGYFSDNGAASTSSRHSRDARGINRARMSDQNFSLSDLLADHSSAGDEKLADVVAKVGRYFFSRCYEWAVLPDGDLERSIWSDRAVLRECERRGSGFKLMIAYAQNPVENRRRTLSEPAKPTPAVMGTAMMREYDRVMRR